MACSPPRCIAHGIRFIRRVARSYQLLLNKQVVLGRKSCLHKYPEIQRPDRQGPESDPIPTTLQTRVVKWATVGDSWFQPSQMTPRPSDWSRRRARMRQKERRINKGLIYCCCCCFFYSSPSDNIKQITMTWRSTRRQGGGERRGEQAVLRTSR